MGWGEGDGPPWHRGGRKGWPAGVGGLGGGASNGKRNGPVKAQWWSNGGPRKGRPSAGSGQDSVTAQCRVRAQSRPSAPSVAAQCRCPLPSVSLPSARPLPPGAAEVAAPPLFAPPPPLSVPVLPLPCHPAPSRLTPPFPRQPHPPRPCSALSRPAPPRAGAAAPRRPAPRGAADALSVGKGQRPRKEVTAGPGPPPHPHSAPSPGLGTPQGGLHRDSHGPHRPPRTPIGPQAWKSPREASIGTPIGHPTPGPP